MYNCKIWNNNATFHIILEKKKRDILVKIENGNIKGNFLHYDYKTELKVIKFLITQRKII